MSNLLAIDPGPSRSAVVHWDGQRILFAEILDNHAALNLLTFSATPAVYCERVESYGMAVGREVFETCFWTGRFWDRCKGSFHLVPRREVKLHLCGQTRAKDSNIIQALKDRFGDKGTKKAPGLTYGLKADLWQAFALAVTCGDLPELSAKYRAEIREVAA